MKKIIKLKESDLVKIAMLVIAEQTSPPSTGSQGITPQQQAALDAGFGTITDDAAKQLIQQGKLKMGSTTGTTTTTTSTTTTSKFGVDYKYNYPGDKAYVYGYKDGKWYAKNVATNREFDLSTNPKWKSSIDNLNKQFVAQIKTPEPTPTIQQYQYQNQYQYQAQRDNTYVKPMVPPQLQK